MDPYVCDKCKRRFNRKFDCTRHLKNGSCKGIKNSSKVKPQFSCDHCKKTFTHKSSCADHIIKKICFNPYEKKGPLEAYVLDFESSEGLFCCFSDYNPTSLDVLSPSFTYGLF